MYRFPPFGHFSMDYGELLGIIQGYVIRSSISDPLIMRCDSLMAVNSLISVKEDLFELGALAIYFIDKCLPFFWMCLLVPS